MRFHTAINKFCWQAALDLPLTVWRTALDQRRPYLDLSDAVRAITFAIEQDLFDGRVYNVVTLNATVRQLIETIESFVPALSIEYVDTRIMNQLSYNVSSARLTELGFCFTGNLENGIRETIGQLEGLCWTIRHPRTPSGPLSGGPGPNEYRKA
jgi:nucleoside-diphosphate-sugar epimerase